MNQGLQRDSSLCTYHRDRFSVMLGRMCHEYAALPSSYAITGELERIEEFPCGRGGNADVYRGVYQGSKVTIKELRVLPRRDLVSVEKVQPSALQLRSLPHTDENEIEFLSRSGTMETAQSPKPVTTDRGSQIFPYPGDGFRLDGTWHNHGFYYCVPRYQPAQTSKHYPLEFKAQNTH